MFADLICANGSLKTFWQVYPCVRYVNSLSVNLILYLLAQFHGRRLAVVFYDGDSKTTRYSGPYRCSAINNVI